MTDFSTTKALFDLPEGVIYLDGNSLGPLPRATSARVAQTVEKEWGNLLIRGWNEAGWMAQPSALGDRIARLIGAPEGHVITGDTLSIKVFQALAAALHMRPERKEIISDTGNFPSDLYMAEGLIKGLRHDHKLTLVEPGAYLPALNENVAATMITQVDYRTGALHDMHSITRAAHEAGALAIWDLAHSAGALPVDLLGCDVDFAVGCTYKYLNAGPGAPAFIYISPRHIETVAPMLSGWLGHDAPFAFELSYRPGARIERMRVGTPPVLQMAALDAALDIWDQIDMSALRKRSQALTGLFIEEVEARCPELSLVTPRDPDARGSQVSFAFPNGYAAMQALIAQGVVGDFRAPDIMRFGVTPLYIDETDIRAAAVKIEQVIKERLWDRPEYQTRNAVT